MATCPILLPSAFNPTRLEVSVFAASTIGPYKKEAQGEPSGKYCEPTNNRPFRTGFYFQFKFVTTGPNRLIGFRVKSVIEPDTQYAKIAGCCEGEVVYPLPPIAPI